MGFKAKHEFQLKNMRLGFKVLAKFILFSNAWLWVLEEPYPKSANVRWISNLVSNSPFFYTLLKFLGCLKIYSIFLNTTQIPWLFEDLVHFLHTTQIPWLYEDLVHFFAHYSNSLVV